MPVLGPQQHLVQNMRALQHRDVAALVDTVRASGAAPVITLAFEFLVLTPARSGEVRRARWAEITRSALRLFRLATICYAEPHD